MLDKHDHARGWLLKGDSDLQTVRTLLGSGGPFDTACFHAHQAVEKYLKAVLAFAERPIPGTHKRRRRHYQIRPSSSLVASKSLEFRTWHAHTRAILRWAAIARLKPNAYCRNSRHIAIWSYFRDYC